MRQLALDAHLRAAILADHDVAYALAYGSLTQGQADQFSDLDYFLYVADPAQFNLRAWLEGALRRTDFQVLHSVINEFGTPNFVVSGLIRVELHAEATGKMTDLTRWPNEHIFPSRMLIKDRDGQLYTLLRQLSDKARLDSQREGQQLVDRALNWLVFGANVLQRGERLRALDILWWLQMALLRLARLRDHATNHWLNPTRQAEQELSPEMLEQHARLIGNLDDLERSYAQAWAWLQELADRLGLRVPSALKAELTATLAE